MDTRQPAQHPGTHPHLLHQMGTQLPLEQPARHITRLTPLPGWLPHRHYSGRHPVGSHNPLPQKKFPRLLALISK